MSALRNLYSQNNSISYGLLFEINQCFFSINTFYVRQIVESQKVKYKSNRSKSVIGMIVVHDELIPIVDLRVKLGLKIKPYNDRTSFLILNVEDRYLGIVVDKVINIININKDNVQYDCLDSSRMNRIISGSYKSEQREIFLLDPLKI